MLREHGLTDLGRHCWKTVMEYSILLLAEEESSRLSAISENGILGFDNKPTWISS